MRVVLVMTLTRSLTSQREGSDVLTSLPRLVHWGMYVGGDGMIKELFKFTQ